MQSGISKVVKEKRISFNKRKVVFCSVLDSRARGNIVIPYTWMDTENNMTCVTDNWGGKMPMQGQVPAEFLDITSTEGSVSKGNPWAGMEPSKVPQALQERRGMFLA